MLLLVRGWGVIWVSADVVVTTSQPPKSRGNLHLLEALARSEGASVGPLDLFDVAGQIHQVLFRLNTIGC